MEIVGKLSQVTTSSAQSVFINLEDSTGTTTQYEVPSIGHIENEISRIDKNFNSIIGLDGGNVTVRMSDGSFKKIIQDEQKGVFYSLRDITSLNSLVSVKGNKFDFSNPSNNELPLTIDFEKMDGDTYVVEDVRDLRVVYNERSINIFFKSINALVKFKNSVFADITSELLVLR
jgi:hypothetical protein